MRLLRWTLATAALVAACTPTAHTLDPDLEVADSLVADWVDTGRVPGAVLHVRRGGEVLLERAYGWASVGRQIPMGVETIFDLASVTKVTATTLAVMLLVDRGLLDVEAPVSTYLPDFTGGGKEAITLRHLLTHRSGLYQWVPTYYHATNADEAYAYIRGLPLAWPVGEGRHYSDLGFMVLGRLVERVSGEPLDHFVAENVHGPLGLTSTAYRRTVEGGSNAEPGRFAATSHGNPYEQRMVHDPDFGYRIEGDPDAWNGWRNYELVGEVNDGNAYHAFRGVAGHAGLFSTAHDLGTIVQMLLDGGTSGDRRLLSEDVIRLFLTSTGDAQALGWQLPDYAPAGSFAHTGFTGTYVLGVPSQDLVVVLLTNRQNFGVDMSTQYPDVGPLQREVATALTGGGTP